MAHAHNHAATSNKRRLAQSFWIIALFMLVEVIGGFYANSLTLLADAAHMLLDASALGLSWFALRLTEKENDASHSYGYHRFQILAAFTNGLTLLALSAWIFIEAISRLQTPATVLPLPLLLVAVSGLMVNLLAFMLLHQGAAHNLNMRAALLHVLGDILGSVAAIVAALVIYVFAWNTIDPLLAFLVVLILFRGALKVVLEAGHILLEGVPRGLSLEGIKGNLIEGVSAVEDIHHVHVWALTPELPMITLHAIIAADCDDRTAIADIKALIRERFCIEHSTIQIEREQCSDGHGPHG